MILHYVVTSDDTERILGFVYSKHDSPNFIYSAVENVSYLEFDNALVTSSYFKPYEAIPFIRISEYINAKKDIVTIDELGRELTLLRVATMQKQYNFN